MSYENLRYRTYTFEPFDYGGASGARVDKIIGPKGKAGRLIDYGVVSITEDFAGTTSATIAVGTPSDPDAYGNELALNGGTTAVGARSVQSLYNYAADKTDWDAHMLEEDLAADTAVWITSTEAVTGGITGQAMPFVVVAWED